jgi:peptidoglycan L-alanyl-D-glutamate endopeptidase CwlK
MGYHSNDQQAVEYGKGRTQAALNPLGYSHIKAQPNVKQVTNAKPGTSMHQYRLALDYCLLNDKGKDVWTVNADWKRAAAIAKKLSFFWGADFQSIYDPPHLEMTFGLTVKDLLAGKTPPTKLGEADELSAEEKKELVSLRSEVKALSDAVAGLTNSKDVLKQAATEHGQSIAKVVSRLDKLEGKTSLTEIPDWANDAVQAAFDAGLIDTPTGGSLDFYRVITVLARAGLLITRSEDK